MARGSGKTRGLISGRMVEIAKAMPGSLNALIVPSFSHFQQKIVGPLKQGLADRRYYEGVHYMMGKYGEPSKGFPLPINAPDNGKNIIHVIGGAAFQVFSLAVKGSMNGTSVDSIIADEVKLFDQEQFESECLPANRGNGHLFGHSHLHHSILACTDIPMHQSGNWILEKEKLMNGEQIELIELLQNDIIDLSNKILNGELSLRTCKDMTEQIARIDADLHILRKGRKNSKYEWEPAPSFYFSKASALDNIDILGEDYLDIQKANMTDIEFKASFLNIRTEIAGQAFYPFFEPLRHGYVGKYDQEGNAKADIFITESSTASSKYDMDIHHKRPLDVAFDYGASILTCVIGQEFADTYRVINAMHVLHPGKIGTLVAQVCDYYSEHGTKVVNYYYDHTAIGKGGMTDDDYSMFVVKSFKEKGWKVNEIYCGQAPGHEEKYIYFQEFFKGETAAPKFEYNRHHCESWETAMTLTGVRSTPKGFEKDKRSERDSKFPQEKAPHYTDAFDTLIWFRLHKQVHAISGAADYLTSR
jgi:hypothetical protein